MSVYDKEVKLNLINSKYVEVYLELSVVRIIGRYT